MKRILWIFALVVVVLSPLLLPFEASAFSKTDDFPIERCTTDFQFDVAAVMASKVSGWNQFDYSWFTSCIYNGSGELVYYELIASASPGDNFFWDRNSSTSDPANGQYYQVRAPAITWSIYANASGAHIPSWDYQSFSQLSNTFQRYTGDLKAFALGNRIVPTTDFTSSGGTVPSMSPSDDFTPQITYSVDDMRILGNICVNESQCILPIERQSLGLNLKIKNSLDEVVHEKNYNFRDSILSTFDFEMPEHGEYTLEASWQALVPSIFPDDVTVHTLVLPFTIDGSSYVSGVGRQNCTDQGVCDEFSPYQDCDLTDILCHMRNAGVFIRGILNSFISVSFMAIETSFTYLKTTLTDKLGFLLFPFTAITDIFSALIVPVSPTSPQITFANVLGSSPLVLNYGALEDVAPSIFNVSIIFLRGLIILSLIGGLMHKYYSVVRS